LRENAMLHVLDLGASYWSLWTEAENLARYNEKYPNGFRALQRRIGYRVRPAWVWQRKRLGTFELIIAIANDGVAAIPGVLVLTLLNAEGSYRSVGSLDGGQPYAGKIRQCSFLLPADMQSGELKLSAQIETKGVIRREVRWACKQPLNPDGSFAIKLKAADASGWLKGV